LVAEVVAVVVHLLQQPLSQRAELVAVAGALCRPLMTQTTWPRLKPLRLLRVELLVWQALQAVQADQEAAEAIVHSAQNLLLTVAVLALVEQQALRQRAVVAAVELAGWAVLVAQVAVVVVPLRQLQTA
jgi:hypothetical protein